ncbi:hypothetical protein CPBF427_36900 [Xanthomonas arboricola pv. juglandis]|nr:hypothetical protein CPBF427_36900 [Xanthomonas arboricola pv. juglandis]
MALGEDQQGVQACLLECGAEQQREVETRSQARAFDLAGAAHLLARLLEAGGGQGIVQLHVSRGPPEGRGKFPGALGAAGIAIQCGVAIVLTQHLGGSLEQPIHGRIVGLDEGGDQVRQMRDAAPLVAWQQLQMAVALREGRGGRIRAHGAQGQRDRGRLGLGQPRQQSAVQIHVQVADRIAGARGQRVDPPTARLQKGRIGRQDQLDLLMLLIGLVDQPEIPQQRDRILKVRQVQFGDQGNVDFQFGSGGRIFQLCLVHGIPCSALS